jgi:predicted transcriptional regulator
VQMTGIVGVSGSVVLRFMLITGPQLRAARALLGMEQVELAKRARVARGTIRRMESFEGEIGARTGTLALVQRVLEKAGVEFLNDGQPGVRMRAKK